jgi:glycosyltransferase involved in cell wall biosynthesis
MKILSVTITSNENNAQWIRISNIFQKFNEIGCDIKLYHYLHKKNIPFNPPLKNEYFIVSNLLLLFFKNIQLLKKERFDLIYANTMGGMIFSIGGKIKGIPIILDMHGISEEYDFKNPNKKWSINLFFHFLSFISIHSADAIVCVSNKMIEYYSKEKKISNKKLIYGPNGVDLNRFKKITEKEIENLKLDLAIQEKFVMGYIGGSHKYQGVDNLIELANKFENKNVIFLFIGDFPEKRYDNIIMMSSVPYPIIHKYYSICDVLILPRPHHLITEVAAPTKFAEYCSMGIPILSTNVGDASNLIKKYRNGLLIENLNEKTLKEAVDTFLNLKKEEIMRMGLNSRFLAENEFDWNKISFNILESIKCMGLINPKN